MEEYITDIKELTAKKVLIYINDAPSFALYKNEPEKLGLNSGDILNEEKKAEIYKLLYDRALNRSLGLIRARDYTVYEIRIKLNNEHYPEEIITELITELKDKKFLDDKRYANNYINVYSSSRSFSMIKQNLLKKGIDKALTDELIQSFSEVEPEAEDNIINKLLLSKYNQNITFADEREKYKFKSKVLSFLLRKGFSYEKADSAVKNFFDI